MPHQFLLLPKADRLRAIQARLEQVWSTTFI